MSAHTWKVSADLCENCGITGEEYLLFGYPHCLYANNYLKSCCGGSGNIRWSDTDKLWRCTDCGSTKSTDPNYYWTPKNKSVDPIHPTWLPVKKCECGGEKAKTTHARYCPKYE